MVTYLRTSFKRYSLCCRVLLYLCIQIWSALSFNLQAQEADKEFVVWRVSFSGNEAYRNKVIREIIATSTPAYLQKLLGRTDDYILDEIELRRDAIRIERFYQRRGYHRVHVRYEVEELRKANRKKVTFLITEGHPLRITSSQIIFDVDEDVNNEIIRTRDFRRLSENHPFRIGHRFKSVRIPETEGRFLTVLKDQGYAWAEVALHSEIDSASQSVDVEILLTPNQKTFLSDFIIDGDLSVSESLFLRQADLKPGTTYSQSKIRDAQRSLFNHHLFRFATITLPDQDQDSTLTTYIRVREFPLRTIQASAGIDREEYFRGQITWQHRNINGRAHRFGTNIRASFIEQFVSADYLFPYVFNSKSSSVTTVFGRRKFEPAFELQQTGLNSSLIYNFRRNIAATISYEYSINDEIDRSLFFRTPISLGDYKISSFRFSGYYMEGISREPRGWVFQPFIEISGTLREADYRFQKFSLDLRRFTALWPAATLAKRVYSGAILSSQPGTLPNNILYYTGGTNSVRGWYRHALGPKLPSFDETGTFQGYVPMGGRAVFNFNVELRQQFGRVAPNLGLAAFLDGGQVWNNVNTLDERPVQFGAGAGLRYVSPIGPIRIDLAYKLNPSDEDLNIFEGENYGSGWNKIGIHFSIGQAF
ncbi:MAG: hypothetical protein EA359_03045 [Balneolaceae bacterium]|nr:MAG: hypothetical protein EA359_03045 [Balneolaceae bacterium]